MYSNLPRCTDNIPLFLAPLSLRISTSWSSSSQISPSAIATATSNSPATITAIHFILDTTNEMCVISVSCLKYQNHLYITFLVTADNNLESKKYL